MKIRRHAGGLAESMATVVEIASTRAAVAVWATDLFGLPVQPSEIWARHAGVDDRTGWDTWLVGVPEGVLGMSDALPL
jgi:hypothetical protein